MKYDPKNMICICGAKIDYGNGVCYNEVCPYDFCTGWDLNNPWLSFTINEYRVIYDYQPVPDYAPLRMEIRANDYGHSNNFDRLLIGLDYHMDYNDLLKRLEGLKVLE